MKTSYKVYGRIIIGPMNEGIIFEGKEVEAYTAKQARYLLAKELHEKELKGIPIPGIINLLKKYKVRFLDR